MTFYKNDYFILKKKFTCEYARGKFKTTFKKGKYGKVLSVYHNSLMIEIFENEEHFQNSIMEKSVDIYSQIAYIDNCEVDIYMAQDDKIRKIKGITTINIDNGLSNICKKEIYGPLILYRTIKNNI